MIDTTKFQTPNKNNGFYLHASSVNVNGKALLFLGHSASGKSTISLLLSKKYPIIADDKVWIYHKRNEEFLVCDGKYGLFPRKLTKNLKDQQKKYPLLAVIRIFKSKATNIKSVSRLETCRYIMDAVFEIGIQKKQNDLATIKEWFYLVAKISRKIPGWELTFKKDASIINIIRERFDKKF